MAKGISTIIFMLILGLAFTAQAQTNQEQVQMTDKKILIAYFSHSGNTREVANQIQALTGGELFEVKTVKQYSTNYNTVVQEAREEQDNGARPELAVKVDNMADYDIVILGYPNWWGTIPMGLFTFLEAYDFAGKTIAPFCTHEGSRMGGSARDIARLCPDATVVEGLPVRGGSVKNAGKDVEAWLRKLGLIG